MDLSSTRQFLSQAPRSELKDFLTKFHFPLDYNKTQIDIFLLHVILVKDLKTWRTDDSAVHNEAAKQLNFPTVSLPESHYWMESPSFSEIEVLWPRDWLPSEFPNSRIVSIGFRSFISGKAESVGRGLSIGNRADETLAKVLLARKGCQDRPIVFLSHSMGGLIVKHLLVKSYHYTAVHSTPIPYQNLLDQWRGIVFFSTPHFGAILPHQSARTRLIHSIYQPSIEVLDLCVDHPTLTNLHKEFTNLLESKRQVKTLSYGESISTPLINGNNMVKYFVVLPESSNPIKVEEQKEDKEKQQEQEPESEQSDLLGVFSSSIDEPLTSPTASASDKKVQSDQSIIKPGTLVCSLSGQQQFLLVPNLHHFNICKPASEEDQIYQMTTQFIQTVTGNASSTSL
jgi:hypothetical protein